MANFSNTPINLSLLAHPILPLINFHCMLNPQEYHMQAPFFQHKHFRNKLQETEQRYREEQKRENS
jgi:hypothetical protein